MNRYIPLKISVQKLPATAGPEPESIIYSRNQSFQICDRCRLARMSSSPRLFGDFCGLASFHKNLRACDLCEELSFSDRSRCHGEVGSDLRADRQYWPRITYGLTVGPAGSEIRPYQSNRIGCLTLCESIASTTSSWREAVAKVVTNAC